MQHILWKHWQKMILNIYNGPYERKVEMIRHLVKEFQSDAVIHFCHWGCKQSSGGSVLLKERLQKKGIPMLILDGDGIDRRTAMTADQNPSGGISGNDTAGRGV